MTERLYYRDATCAAFTARIVRSWAGQDGRVLTVLDRTAFYPTSGGQPFDTGRLGGHRVVDVIEDEAGDVLHVTDGSIDGAGEVAGEIDWTRRFDHMQQHTGQHVLSAAFERTSGTGTVSFHLGATAATIDLVREVSPAEIERAETDANAVVWENRPVTVRFVDALEAASLPLRKAPKRDGILRLVEVADFDLSACGGTHVTRTGAIGVITIAGWERFKSGSRITFQCGQRALDGYRHLRDGAREAGRLLSVGAADIAGAIARLGADLRASEKRLTELSAELAALRAVEWRAGAETIGPLRVVLRCEPGADGGAIKSLAHAIVSGETGLVAVVVGGGRPAPIAVARSADLDLDAGALVRSVTTALGGRGGGRPEFAQGGVDADPEAALVKARQLLGRF